MVVSTDPFHIEAPVWTDEYKLLLLAVNQAIDSYLEGFTEANFSHYMDGPRLICDFKPGSLKTLLRRLREMSDEGINQTKLREILGGRKGWSKKDAERLADEAGRYAEDIEMIAIEDGDKLD